MKKYHVAETVIGCDNNDISLTYARSNRVIDSAMNDLRLAVVESDLVILATPPSTMESVAATIGGSLKKHAIIMDTASVKVPIMKSISKFLPSHVDFIPAHPIAGSEKSGVRAGNADLFKGKRVIVTPDELLQDNVLQTITRFWELLGAKVEGIPPALHDVVYAHVSHLPQVLAYAAAQISSEFKDNRENVIAALDRYLDALWHIKGELARAPEAEQSGDDAALTHTVLFPRIAASCLITTVMEAEKKAGFSFARYAGTGFADFTSPVTVEPDADIEQISSHYLSVLAVIQDYIVALKDLREKIMHNQSIAA
jgi:prephenate dehydrogenase